MDGKRGMAGQRRRKDAQCSELYHCEWPRMGCQLDSDYTVCMLTMAEALTSCTVTVHEFLQIICLFIELALHEFRHLLHTWSNKIWYFKSCQATLERISTRATRVTICLVETESGCSTVVVGPNLPVHRQWHHQHPSSELEKLLIIPMILLFVRLRTFV